MSKYAKYAGFCAWRENVADHRFESLLRLPSSVSIHLLAFSFANPLVRIVPPIEEWLIILVANAMMHAMPFRSTRPPLGQYFIISPLQIHTRMYVHQHPDEQDDKDRPSQNM